jgi:hypothetical protein
MRPLTTIRAIGLVAAGAMLIAACSGAGTATTAPATAAPATTGPATQAPGPTEVPGSSPGLSFALPSFHGDTDLEGMIPTSIGGETLTVLSMTGDQFLGNGTTSPELAGALQALGKTTSDLSVAFAGSSTLTVVAFRVKGVAANALYDAFKAAETDDSTATNVSFGGKTVVKLVSADSTAYIYLKDDTMFVIGGSGETTPTDALLNEAFSKLP